MHLCLSGGKKYWYFKKFYVTMIPMDIKIVFLVFLLW